MPELPEVETIVRTLAPQITGARVAGVDILLPKTLVGGAEYLPQLAGAVITRVFRRAKLAMVELAPGGGAEPLFLAFHLKMTGRFFVHPADTAPLKHTRLIFNLTGACPGESDAESPRPQAGTSAFSGGAAPCEGGLPCEEAGPSADDTPCGDALSCGEAVLCGRGTSCGEPISCEETPPPRKAARLFFDDMRTFGYCRIMRQADFALWPFWEALGPEPLETAPALLARRFQGHKKSIKGVLLDQTVVAGVGNIYADESLFQAGILPAAKASSLTLPRLTALAEALQAILRLSIEECGSSIRDYRDANGDAGSFQNNFAVYGRKGQPCRRCGGTLIGSTVAGRGTVHCPECQKG